MKPANLFPVTVTLLLLAGLVIASDGAVAGAKAALATCGNLILPALFPFFVVSYLISGLGLPGYLGSRLQRPMALLFGTSGTGASVFLLGILGGYPLGAAVLADLVQRGELPQEEARRLLAFCNNSGPAFLVGAVGVGLFRSAGVGLLVYGVHLLSALLTGLFLSGTRLPAPAAEPVHLASISLSVALPEAISKAAGQILQICGYITFFGAVTGTLEELGLFSAIYGQLAAHTGLSLQCTRALCCGVLELGSGIGALQGAALSPGTLALCSFLTGFGGLSVCLQTAGVLQGSGIPVVWHVAGRLCCGGLGAFIMVTIASFML